MAMENANGLMDTSIKVNGKMGSKMVKENKPMLMELSIKVNLKMGR